MLSERHGIEGELRGKREECERMQEENELLR